MSYYDEVYIKRLSKRGRNRQEVVKRSRENEFELSFMKGTIYKATIYAINNVAANIIISLQPNKYNESSIISNILMSLYDDPLQTGDIVSIRMEVDGAVSDKNWLVLFVKDDTLEGHRNFKVISLDTELNITDEYGNSIHSTPAKIINASQSIMQDTITRSLKELGYREPQTQRILIAPRADEIKKGAYFEYDGRGWEIIGQDVLSIPGVSYVFIGEKLLEEPEPLSSEDLLVGENTNFFLNGR